ncbi:MAG: hypothetical protein ACREFP_07005 [Acetobacteraceae bacterium]
MPRPKPLLPIDCTPLIASDIVEVRDPREMDATSRVSQRLRREGALFSYRLQDRSLLRASFDQPIAILAGRRVGNMLICHSSNQFATQLDIQGDGINGFCFQVILQGKVRLLWSESEAIQSGADGAVLDEYPGAKILTSDVSERQNLWIKADALEHALEGMLDERLRRRLQFAPGVDWSTGLTASLKGQIGFLIHEATRPDGAADNPVALASMTDLILALARLPVFSP